MVKESQILLFVQMEVMLLMQNMLAVSFISPQNRCNCHRVCARNKLITIRGLHSKALGKRYGKWVFISHKCVNVTQRRNINSLQISCIFVWKLKAFFCASFTAELGTFHSQGGKKG